MKNKRISFEFETNDLTEGRYLQLASEVEDLIKKYELKNLTIYPTDDGEHCMCRAPDPYFSRTIPMEYFCGKCGREINSS